MNLLWWVFPAYTNCKSHKHKRKKTQTVQPNSPSSNQCVNGDRLKIGKWPNSTHHRIKTSKPFAKRNCHGWSGRWGKPLCQICCRLEVCGNTISIPIPSHSHWSIPIPVYQYFYSHSHLNSATSFHSLPNHSRETMKASKTVQCQISKIVICNASLTTIYQLQSTNKQVL